MTTHNARQVSISESSAFPEFQKTNRHDEPSQSTSESHTTSTHSRSASYDMTDHSSLSHDMSDDAKRHKRNSFKRKGDYSFRCGDYDKAVARYSRALDLDPENHVLLSNRSAAHLALGDTEQAIEDAKRCIAAKPSDCRGHSRLAVAFQTMEKWEAALDCYHQVLELESENEIAHRGIELCTKALRDKEEIEQENDIGEKDVQENPPMEEVRFENAARRRSSAGGMSELSKHLRVLQSTIHAQSDEIELLQRKLHITSLMKGVQKAQLDSALKRACEDEAHDELLRQIDSLRTQLESMTLLNSSERPSSFNPSRAIAMLQLRVGELEEVENNLRDEIRELYLSLQRERENSAKQAATCEQQKKQLVELLKSVTLVKTPSKLNLNSQWSVVAEDKMAKEETLAEKYEKAQLQLKLERDKAKLLEIQVEAREVEAQLHKEQFKSRLQLQQDRIQELELQLSQTSNASEQSMVNSEDDAIEEEQDLDMEIKAEVENEIQWSPPPSTPASSRKAQQSTSPSSHTDVYSSLNNVFESQKVTSGFLLKRDHKNVLKGWKKRYFCLNRSFGTYQLTYSEGPGLKVKGNFENIVTGVSTVEQTHEFSKQPYCFALKVNPKDSQAPVLYAAAASQAELDKWMQALTIAATGGGEYQVAAAVSDKESADSEMVSRMKKLDKVLTSYGVP